MEDLWRRLFKQKESLALQPLEIGSKWCLRQNADIIGPWEPTKPPCIATILDVYDGWVRYSLGRIFDDCRMEESLFRSIYHLMNEN